MKLFNLRIIFLIGFILSVFITNQAKAQLDDEASTTDLAVNEDDTVTEENGEEPVVVEENGEEPAVEENGEEPAVEENSEEPAVEENSEEPAVEENSEEPAVEENTGEPTEEPAVEETTGESTEEENSEQPTVDISTEGPAVEETTGEPAVEETTGEPAVEETTGEPAVEETTGEPAVEETTGEPAVETTTGEPTEEENTEESTVDISTGEPSINTDSITTEQIDLTPTETDNVTTEESSGDDMTTFTIANDMTTIYIPDPDPDVTDVITTTMSMTGSDECEPNQFRCDSKCIDGNKRCDTINDCEDRSDEQDCVVETTTGAPKGLYIVIKPEGPIKIKNGESLQITCTVYDSSRTDLEAVFYKDQAPVGTQDQNPAVVDIQNARRSDAGTYYCYGFTSDRSEYKVTPIQVEFEHDDSQSSIPTITVKGGETAQLVCEVDSNYDTNQISWRKQNGELNQRNTRPHENKLYIYYAEPQDSGVYECYDANTALGTFRFVVEEEEGPATSRPEDPQTPRPTDEEIYQVRASVDPKEIRNSGSVKCIGMTNGNDLEIEWYNVRNNNNIRNNRNFVINTITTSDGPLTKESTLTLINPTEQGLYECRVIVTNGKTTTDQFELILDSISTSTSPSTIICQLNEATCRNGQCIPRSGICNGVPDCADSSDELNCSGPDRDGCEPNEKKCDDGKCLQKYWFCDGDRDCADGSDEKISPLHCPNRTAQSVGDICQTHEFKCSDRKQCIPKGFVCDGENDCVDQSDELGCVEPRIIKGPTRNITVYYGQTLTIECTASGFPIPYINWRLNWGHICKEPRCYTTSVDGHGVLTITNTLVSDSGAYSCEAINSKGRIFAIPDAQLTVKITEALPVPCNCYNHASRCTSDGTCINCEHSTTGKHCDLCLPGYTGEARYGTPNDCQRESVAPGPCKPGVFQYYECNECFCNGLVDNCRSSDLYYNKIEADFRQSRNAWTIHNLNGYLNTAKLNVNQEGALQFSNVNDYSGDDLYFVAPKEFTGNKITSYGGKLSFTINYEGRSVEQKEMMVLDIRILGTLIAIRHNYTAFLKPYADHTIEVPLKEALFHRVGDSSSVSRDHMLMALSNITIIMIRANIVKTQYLAALKKFSLDVGKEHMDPSRNEQVRALAVEQCPCPEGYTGTSCEACASGYKKDNTGFYLGLCVRDTKCDCNGYSNSCDPSGRCLYCQENTIGERCDRCKEGFVRTDGSSRGCRIDLNIYIYDDNVQLKQKDDRIIYVQITGNVKPQSVYWERKDGNRLPYGVREQGRNLEIINAQPEINGIYVIRCRTPYGEVRKEVTVNVQPEVIPGGYPPRIIKPIEKVVYGDLQQEFIFECIAEGNPLPNIQLRTPRGQENVLPDNSRSASTIATAKLSIFPFSELNVGEYVCIASNIYGQVEETISVQMRPSRPSEPLSITVSPRYFEVTEGSPLFVTVHYTGQEPVGITVELLGTRQVPVNYANFDRLNKRIIISRVEKSMDGQYIVKATNPYETRQDMFTLRVLDAPNPQPQIYYTETTLRLISGQTLKIEPRVIYNGKPSYSWDKDGSSLPEAAILQDYILTIPNLKQEHEGVYTLRLDDSYGSARISVKVIVTPQKPAGTGKRIFVLRDMDLDLNAGDSVNLICNLKTYSTNNMMTTTTWFKGRRAQRARFPSNIRPNHELLQLNKVRIEDSGEYTCMFTTMDSNFQTAVVNLRVRAIENQEVAPTAKMSESEKTVYNDDSFELRCFISGSPPPSIVWIYNQNVIRASTNIDPRNEKLVFTRIQPEMSGYYTCRAVSANGQIAEDSTLVNVNTRTIVDENDLLQIEVSPQTTSKFVGDSIEFSCAVSSGNVANIRLSWSKQDESFPSNAVDRGNGVLTLQNIEEANRGSYICTAQDSNTGRTRTAAANLIVSPVDKVDIPLRVVVRPKTATLIEGRAGEFYCEVEGGNNPTITWRRHNGDLSDRYEINRNVFKINKVEADDRGYFQCIAQSGEDTASDHVLVEVEVRKAPKVQVSPREPRVLNYGGSAYLQCYAEAGEPKPTIEWKRIDNKPFSSKVTLNEDNTLLTIVEAGDEEFGTYVCTGRNSEGEDSGSVVVLTDEIATSQPNIPDRPNVEPTQQPEQPIEGYSPVIYQTSGVLEVIEGDEAILECRVANPNEVRFQWHKSSDDRAFKANTDGSLIITRVNNEDAGYYTCTVNNAHGTAYIDVQLKVNPKPSSLRVNVKPKERVVPLNGHAEFSCMVSSNSDSEPLVRWSKTEGSLPDSHTIIGNVLRISDIRSEHSGRYMCTAQVNSEVQYDIANLEVSRDDPKSAFPVYVKVLETPIYSIQTPSGAYKYGSQITAECNAKSADVRDVTWSRIEGVIRNVVQFEKQSSNSNTMKFPTVLPMDLGTYVCLATLNDGTQGQSIVIFERSPEQPNQFRYVIHGPREIPNDDETHVTEPNRGGTEPGPEFGPEVKISGEKNIDVNEGDEIRIKCDVKGNPQPEVTWEKHGGSLPDNHRIEHNALRLYNLQEKDAGYYICNAKNLVNSERDYVYLRINKASENPGQPRTDQTESSEQPGEEPREDTTAQPNVDNQDNQQETFEVKVTSEKNVEVVEGASAEITCVAKGSPTPEITWEKHGDPPLSDVNHRIENNVLRLFNLKESESGYYICNAKNEENSSRDYAYVRVNKAPEAENTESPIDNSEHKNEMEQSTPVPENENPPGDDNDDIILDCEGENCEESKSNRKL